MIAIVLALAGCGRPGPPNEDLRLVALAASSLADVMPELARAWAAQTGRGTVTFTFEGSSKLARQVEAGAPADLVFLADVHTMDRLERDGLLAPGSRRDLAGNGLVVVVPEASAWTPSSPADLASPRLEHLALAGENVPAGRYARGALAAAGVRAAVAPRTVTGDNVRTALAWVARGEADAGVVYATDARAEDTVRVAFAFPSSSHEPIVYPAAVVASSAHVAAAEDFLAFCASDQGAHVFGAHGFTVLSP